MCPLRGPYSCQTAAVGPHYSCPTAALPNSCLLLIYTDRIATQTRKHGMLCPICHDDSCRPDFRLDCGHAFGPLCIHQWCKAATLCAPTCPVCRRTISMENRRDVLRCIEKEIGEYEKDAIRLLSQVERAPFARQLTNAILQNQDPVDQILDSDDSE